MAEYSMQRQRHGVTRNLVEGVGGFIVGTSMMYVLNPEASPKAAPGAPEGGQA